MPAWMAASVVVACTVAVVAFLLRARVNRARAAAYGAESAITG
jgi:NO-binding membrane sensor protein with MHYT domain